MDKELKIYYSKAYKTKWFSVLAILLILYVSIFFILAVKLLFIFHVLAFLYLTLIVISLYRPYLRISGGKIQSSFNMLKTLNVKRLKGVFVVDGEYVFREDNKSSLYIDLNLVSVEDKKKVIAFLEENELLKTTYDVVEDLFKM